MFRTAAASSRLGWILLALVGPTLALPGPRAATMAPLAPVDKPVEARHGLVVSVSPPGSDVGLEILQKGGNAVDAAVATAFALAVTYPAAGNIGGGGFMMVHTARTGETVNIEYREMAPAAATPEIFRKLKQTSRGHMTVGVPGTVRGLALAHERYGSLPWNELLEPAITLAEDGFLIDGALAWSLNYVERQSIRFPELRSVFRKPDLTRWQSGDLLVQKDLAHTLRLIAETGPDAFYTGPIAGMLVDEIRAGSGLITKEDLAAYQANVRTPIHITYRGYDVYAPPPPSSGGVTLAEMLGMLENSNLTKEGRTSVAATHRMIEVMRRAYLDRAKYLGDPAFSDIPIARLNSPEYLKGLAETISPDHATPSEELGRDILVGREGPSTTHFSIVDREGNAVSNTYTLEESYGSHVMVHGAGFLLNSELTDFNLHPGVTDRLGEIGTEPNVIAPHKRILSSQTPVIVLRDGQVFLVTGSPGGRTIINTVLQVLVNVIDFQLDVRAAVDAPRLHHPWMPDVVQFEEKRIPEEARKQLEAMGHHFDVTDRLGDAHTIWVDPETALRHGAADKRIDGKAAGY